MSRDAEHLVGQVERFFFETNAITSLLGNAPGLCLGRLAHGGQPYQCACFCLERG